jgi:hypothetical protein
MKRLILVLVAVILGLSLPLSADAKRQVDDAESVKSEAVKGFEEILELWRTENYGDLYKRTLISGKDTKESFSKRMAAARLKPSCCWEKMQEVSVRVKSPASVVISAKLGLDAPGGIVYKTKSFKLNREDDLWCIARADILSLAEAKKVKGSHKHSVSR